MHCLNKSGLSTDVNYFVQQPCIYCCLLSVSPGGDSGGGGVSCIFMMVYLVHHNFMLVKVSMLGVHSDIENCSELRSVVAFCTIANYTLVGKCVLLIVTLLQLSNVKMSHWTKCCKTHASLQVAILILSPLQRIYIPYIYMCVYVCGKSCICVCLYITVFNQIILTGVDSNHNLNFLLAESLSSLVGFLSVFTQPMLL